MPLMYNQASLQMEWCINCHRSPEKNLRPHYVKQDPKDPATLATRFQHGLRRAFARASGYDSRGDTYKTFTSQTEPTDLAPTW